MTYDEFKLMKAAAKAPFSVKYTSAWPGGQKFKTPITITDATDPELIEHMKGYLADDNDYLISEKAVRGADGSFDNDAIHPAYDPDKVYETKDGKKPHAVSANWGSLTSMLLPMAAGGAIGGLLSKNDRSIGIQAGAGAGLLAALVMLAAGGIAGSVKKLRTNKEQMAYNESSTAPEWLIPGVGMYNLTRSTRKGQNDYMTQPLELQVYGKNPFPTDQSLLDAFASKDVNKIGDAVSHLKMINDVANGALMDRWNNMHPYSDSLTDTSYESDISMK